MIFETHAHYDDQAFDEDREALLQKFEENQISYVVNVASSLDSIKSTLKLTREYEFIYGALGIHPSDSGNLTEEDILWVEKECENKKIVAVGEIGLDYYWKAPEKEIQKKWFIRQLQMAKDVKLPVIIHSRDAAGDTMDIMKAQRAEEIGGVIHCFSYSPEIAEEYVKMGFYIGIGGVITFQNAKKLREVVKRIPIERIVLETDSPYLAPVPNRGKRNSSLNLPYIIKEIAGIKNMSEKEIEEITQKNAKQLYKLD